MIIDRHAGVAFYCDVTQSVLALSIGKYDNNDAYYIGIHDDDGLCYQYESFSEELTEIIFDEIQECVYDDDFYTNIFPRTCEKYGLIKNKA